MHYSNRYAITLWSFRTKFAQKTIPGTKFTKAIVKFGITTLEYAFVPGFISTKALWSLGTKFARKGLLRTNNCRIWNEHSWISFCTDFHSKQIILKVRDKTCERKCISGKKIVEFKISILKYSTLSCFILNKALWSLGTKLASKSILGMKYRKINYPSTLFWVTVKQFWVIMGYSANILDHCGSEWIILGLSGS